MSKKTRKIKHALFMSVISMMLCCAMLVGTTFAWFTDEVNSTGNVIKSGKLEVALEWSTDAVTWADASEGAIFDYEHWEPGYTDVKYVKMSNIGNLAFKYQLNVIPVTPAANGQINLADVIDVYCAIVGKDFTVDRANLESTLVKLGTLSELMANPDGADTGVLLPAADKASGSFVTPSANVECYTETVTVCLALKMQESAGNEYQDLSVGDGFRVQLLATQYTYEEDSFDHKYDEDAEYFEGPYAIVRKLEDAERGISSTLGMGGTGVPVTLQVGYQFQPTDTKEEGAASSYADWNADFVISADKDVPANSIAIGGYYAAFCDDYNNGNWVSLYNADAPVAADEEIRIVYAMFEDSLFVKYSLICEYGNDGLGFRCGLINMNDANIGTTITVQLRLYEVDGNGDETGKYLVIGEYDYTITETDSALAQELRRS